MVAHRVNGLLSPLADDGALATHIIELLQDSGLANRLIEEGRAACATCTWPAVRQQWIDVYRGVLRAGAREHARSSLARDES
jgi:hypothetical protein